MHGACPCSLHCRGTPRTGHRSRMCNGSADFQGILASRKRIGYVPQRELERLSRRVHLEANGAQGAGWILCGQLDQSAT